MESIACILLIVTVASARPDIASFDHHVHQQGPDYLWRSEVQKNTTVVDVMRVQKLTVWLDLIGRAGLTKDLTKKGPFTVFAPSTQSLYDLPLAVRQSILTNDTFANEFVSSHILSINVTSSNMTQDKVVKTLNKTDVRFNLYKNGNKTTLTANGGTFAKTNLSASNGVVHIVNKALWPQNQYNIVDLVSSIKSLSKFASEISSSKTDLTGSGPYTVFAPSDDAFAKYSGSDKHVVDYHVTVPSITEYSAGLVDGLTLTTKYKIIIEKPKTLMIAVNSGQISVHGKSNEGNVISADISATNGVIHIIDTVLKPPTF